MKYISLFSGIGGFERGINSVYPNSQCIAYSEIDSYAIRIYQHHFPNHKNLGDITRITKSKIQGLVRKKGCDLIVGGFPCTNLSSMANINGDNRGLDGEKSRLFHYMVRLIHRVQQIIPGVKFIMENNYSMCKSDRKQILDILEKKFGTIYTHMIDNASFGVQTRKRIIWTNFPFSPPDGNKHCTQTWNDVLQPIKQVKKYLLSDTRICSINKMISSTNTKGITRIVIPKGNNYTMKFVPTTTSKSKWEKICTRSDTMSKQLYTYPIGKSRPVLRSGTDNNILIDRRIDKSEKTFIVRFFTHIEMERLFGLPDDYTNIDGISKTRRGRALGNSIPVFIVKHVVSYLL